MIIESPDLIKQFHKAHPEYKDISLSEMKVICTAPFEYLKKVMQTGELEEVRFQYLFVARVSSARVIKHLKDIYKKRVNKRISEESFNKYSEVLLSHINKNPVKFKKYEERIKEITGGNISV